MHQKLNVLKIALMRRDIASDIAACQKKRKKKDINTFISKNKQAKI